MIHLTLLHNTYCYDPESCNFSVSSNQECSQGDTIDKSSKPYDIVCELANQQNDIGRKMCGLILKLTDFCNMSCRYCPHSQKDNPHMKVHSNSVMPEKTILQGIDFLNNHSAESDAVDIVFFGGEPLTEFHLMKKAVCYAEETLKGKQITFNTTTNLLLLNDEMISFFATHRFSICISMDGPREIHDKNRLNRGGFGTFDTVYKNYLKLKKALCGTNSTIRINAVFDEKYDLRSYEGFFSQNEFSDVIVEMNPIDYSGSVSPPPDNPKYHWQTMYVRFLVYLCILGRFPSENLPLTAHYLLNRLRSLYQRLQHPTPLPLSHTYIRLYDYMTCGFIAFLNPQGSYYPGIHVNEMQEEFVIGNAETGIQFEKINLLMNKSGRYMVPCKRCPLLTFCQVPIALAIDANGNAQRLNETYCRNFEQLWKEVASLLLLKQGVLTNIPLLSQFTSLFCDSDNEAALNGIFEYVCHTHDLTNRPVLSEMEGIGPVELLSIVYLIEKNFNIKFEPNDFADFQFGTFEGIKAAVKRYFGGGKQ